jgi:hypothetical protein
MKLLLIVPPALDVALFGAKRFYTNGIKCWDLNGRGGRGKPIPSLTGMPCPSTPCWRPEL